MTAQPTLTQPATTTVEPSDREPDEVVGEHPGDPPLTDTTLIDN